MKNIQKFLQFTELLNKFQHITRNIYVKGSERKEESLF
jgi:hypothetical protein